MDNLSEQDYRIVKTKGETAEEKMISIIEDRVQSLRGKSQILHYQFCKTSIKMEKGKDVFTFLLRHSTV